MSSETEIELQRAFGRMEGKLDSLIHEVRTSALVGAEEVKALQKRVAKLESWRTYMAGGGAAVLFVLGLIWKFILINR